MTSSASWGASCKRPGEVWVGAAATAWVGAVAAVGAAAGALVGSGAPVGLGPAGACVGGGGPGAAHAAASALLPTITESCKK